MATGNEKEERNTDVPHEQKILSLSLSLSVCLFNIFFFFFLDGTTNQRPAHGRQTDKYAEYIQRTVDHESYTECEMSRRV